MNRLKPIVYGAASLALSVGGGLSVNEGAEAKGEQTAAIFSDPAFREHMWAGYAGETSHIPYQPPERATGAELSARTWFITGAALGAAGLAGFGLTVRQWRRGRQDIGPESLEVADDEALLR